MKPLELLIGYLTEQATRHASVHLKRTLLPIGHHVRRVSMGVALILMSALFWFTGFLFLLIAFFAYLSQAVQFVNPSLWTGIGSFCLAIICLMSGLTFVRRSLF